METVRVMETDGKVLMCPFNPENDRSEYGIYGIVVKTPRHNFEISVKEAAKNFGVSELFITQILYAFDVFADGIQRDLESLWERLDEIEGKK